MINKNDYVVVSRKALEQGHIGFIYRDRSSSAHDSGWRMMYDKDENRLDLANPDKVYACDIKKLLKYFTDLAEIIKSRTFSVWQKQEDQWQLLGRDKELELVPHRMTGKTKYVALMTRQGGGAIITADPKDLRHGRKVEDWEMLLPDDVFEKS